MSISRQWVPIQGRTALIQGCYFQSAVEWIKSKDAVVLSFRLCDQEHSVEILEAEMWSES